MHPILFSYGPVHLYSYGFLVAIGVLCAILFIRKHAPRIGVKPETSVDLAMATVISGFVGARIFYVAQHWDFFMNAPLDIFKIWQGGIVLYGGLIGGFLGFSVFIRLNKLSFLPLLDLFVPAMALAQGFGRLGCFLNGCCYGIDSDLPWAVRFPFFESKVHPTQLYEAFFCFILFLFLYRLWKKTSVPGRVSLAYFIIYPLGRFFIEFLRGDQSRHLLNLTSAQWISILVMMISLLILTKHKFGHGKNTARRSS